MSTTIDTDKELDIDLDSLLGGQLILWNDESNTFQHVIYSLVDIVGHTLPQAEQCALIAHTKGKCSVKSGDHDDLRRYRDMLSNVGITTTIE